MPEEKKRSSSLDRRETVYLSPSNYQFIITLSQRTGDTKSSLINSAVKELKNKLEGKK